LFFGVRGGDSDAQTRTPARHGRVTNGWNEKPFSPQSLSDLERLLLVSNNQWENRARGCFIGNK
jgi:hypothetical protein